MTRALFLAAFDSQLKWCSQIHDEFVRRGFETRVIVPDVRSALSPQQIIAAGIDHVERASWSDTVRHALDSDVVVCGLSGPLVKAFGFALADQLDTYGGSPPIFVTGWVGVIIEKIVAGYLDRCGSDVVIVNSTADLELFRSAAKWLGLPAENLLLAGLPFLSSAPQPARLGPIHRVLFTDQPTVPGNRIERLYLYRRLLRYAARHPDREVVLKPRHRPEEDTFHRMRHHPEELLAGEEKPANFRIDYTPVSEMLPSVDLLITMSSTACLEALDAGCRVGLVLDLGVHERYGNHVFLDSGLLRTFADLAEDDIGHPNPEWFHSYFFDRSGRAAEVVADRVNELSASGLRPSGAVRQTAYYKSARQAHREISADDGAVSQPARHKRAAALRKRKQRHGPVRGTLVHVTWALTPPILNESLRRAARRNRPLIRVDPAV
jgi:hypothetical protein